MRPRSLSLRDIISTIEQQVAQGFSQPWVVNYVLDVHTPLSTDPVRFADGSEAVITANQERYQEPFNNDQFHELRILQYEGFGDWIPQHELAASIRATSAESEPVVLSKPFFYSILNKPNLYSDFIFSILSGVFQIVEKTDNSVFLKKIYNPGELVVVDSEERSIISRVSNSMYRVREDRLKRFTKPGPLCEYIQLGIIKAELSEPRGTVTLIKQFNFQPRSTVRPAMVRDPVIDAMFSTPEEKQQRQQEEELNRWARWLSAANGYVQLNDNTFELFEAHECYDCGGPCLLDQSLTVTVKDPQAIKFALNCFDQIPPPGYEDEDPEERGDDGENPIYCTLCRSDTEGFE